jgi:hypothetical protein
MKMRVEVEAVTEGLDDGYYPGHEVPTGTGFHVFTYGSYRT